MEKYNCLVVDDERLAVELLEKYIEKIPFLELTTSCHSAMEAMSILRSESIDIMFLDIQMPNLTGIDFLKSLPSAPNTILTTAYSEYALESYELGVVDYLVKPIEFDRFFKAINKITNKNTASTQPIRAENTPSSDYIFVKSDGKIIKIKLDKILFIEALQKYIRIHTTTQRVTTLLSLSRIQEQLASPPFVRIHRSYIVNVNKIDSLEGNHLTIQKQQLPISKGQKEQLFTIINQFGFL
jgi:DNA-binding LytR/AlgR family response regulator